VQVHLESTEPLADENEDPPDLATWNRQSPLTHAESWRLQDGEAGPWKLEDPPLPTLAPNSEYVIYDQDESMSNRSNFLVFRGSDLARLNPGELLVERSGPPNSQGTATQRLVVIQFDQIKRESCAG
jgi:hypothetical protein